MVFDLQKQTITIDRKIGSETSQLMIEGDIVAPDIKPDIMNILKADAKANLERVDIQTDRVSYQGKLDISVLYISKSDNKPINHMTGSLSIDDFVNLDGIQEGMTCDLDISINHLDCKLINDRKINIRAVLETSICATCAFEKEIITGISEIPEGQVMKTPLKLSRMIECREDKFIIKEELAEPSGKPNIREILNTKAEITNKEVRAQDGKVSIKGELVVKTIFIADTDGNVCDYMEHEVPFSGHIDAKESKDGLFAEASLNINDFYVQIRQDSDGEDRAIEVEAGIYAKIKVYSETPVDMVEDAYAIDKLVKLATEKVKYKKVICRNKNQFPVRETIVLPEHMPKILQVFSIYGKSKLDRIEISEEKVLIEGVVETSVIYIDESDTKPLCSYDAVIPFRQLIDSKGAKGDMSVDIQHSISHSSFSMLSGNEIEARFVLDTLAAVSDESELLLAVDVVVEDADKEFIESIPSLVIYFVENGDTLWKIAKKYNTDIEDLLLLNEIEHGTKLYPKQKLLIMKRRIE